LLAFASIAHFGYMLLALSANSIDGVTASLFYLFVYIFLLFSVSIVFVGVLSANPSSSLMI